MNPKLTAPRGTADTLPTESPRWQRVEAIARDVAERYHFGEIRTPVFERTELFHRGVGETSDVVSKETFTFNDRGNESMTLRPEGTAGVVRAVVEANLLSQEGSRLKVYYIGPNFRYERPQKGRLRIHHQFGVEAFGIAEPQQDVECILLQLEFYRQCGVKDLELQINSLGDRESKQRYRDALIGYLSPKSSALSEDSQRRLTENPLRILDSKDPRDQAACQGAPPASQSLSEKSRAHFERVQTLLAESGAPFRVSANLVRGFDYYTDTLWEVTAGGLGAQNAIGGGGRYDNLVEQLGGKPTPGVGFGSGIERLLIALESQQVALHSAARPLVWLINRDETDRSANWKLLLQLREAGFAADMDYAGRSPKSQYKLAEREGTAFLVDAAQSPGEVLLKNQKTGEQLAAPRGQAIERLRGWTNVAS